MIEPAITTLPTDNAPDTDDLTAVLPPKVRAWTLYCQGYLSPEIGHLLGIPERTVRSWLSRALGDLDSEHTELRANSRTFAIARQRQIAAAAWKGYERALAVAEVESAKAANTDSPANARAATQALSAAARYLRLAAAADRELARLHDTITHQDHSPARANDALGRPTSARPTDDILADHDFDGDPPHRFREVPSSINLAPQPHETAAKTARAHGESLPAMDHTIGIAAKTAIAHHEPPPAAHLTTEIAAISAISAARILNTPGQSAAHVPNAAKTATPTLTPRPNPHRRIALRHVM